MHRRHHSAAFLARLITLGASLALAACGEYDSLKGMNDGDQIDWSAKVDAYSQPGPLGTLINHHPPPITIHATGPYANPLAEPVPPPIITPDIADQVVAQPLLESLNAEGRLSLATASMVAASGATGTAVLWQTADAGGTVVPARDVYLSQRGLVCRDLQQRVAISDQWHVEQVTLCHQDLGDNRILWLPGSPD
jgi:hypothetical protein